MEFEVPEGAKDARKLSEAVNQTLNETSEQMRLLKEKKRRPYYTMANLPPGVNSGFVRPLDKPKGNRDHFLSVIFKCKRKCKTIYTPENLRDMQRFSAKLTSHPLWWR